MKNLLLTAAACMALAAASVGQTLPAYLPSDGLVGWWPFNGNANDESGNGNNGTVYLATLTEDRFSSSNGAFNFNDGPDKITVANSTELQLTNSFTISCWIRTLPNTYGTGNEYYSILSKWGSSGDASYQLAINPSGNLYFRTHNNFNSTELVTDSSLNFDTWYHLLYKQQDNSGKLYLNGVLESESETMNIPMIMNNYVLFGSNEVPLGYYPSSLAFEGIIDDIAIYNRALSQEEITALYTGEPVNPPTACNPLPSNLQNGLVGYWPFCGNANDESGNGNDGTVNGATLTEDRFGVANAAYSFDGVDDVIIPEEINQVIEDWFIGFWFNSDNSSNNFQGQNLIGIGSDLYGYGSAGYQISGDIPPGQCNNFNYLDQMYFFDASEECGGNYVSGGNYSNNIWSHIGISKDSSNYSIFVNGELISTNSDQILPIIPNQLIFGNRYSFNFQFFNGALDDIGIWNRALSAEEVQQLYTLNACTFTIYDTLTIENVVNVFDTTTVVETIFDTVTVVETLYETVYDTVLVSTTDTLIINTLITAVQPAQENTFLVYPNPAGSQITINNGNVAILGGYTMRITNSAGQEVYNQNITQTEVTLDLGNWGGNGLYVLYITDPQGEIIAVKQIVLQ
jgi:hypothetical protein